MKHKNLAYLWILMLSLLGFLDTIILTIQHLIQKSFCGPSSHCLEVLSSTYSRVGGIPVSVFGMSFYLIFSIYAFRLRKSRIKDMHISFLFILSIIGVATSLYFLYIQVFVLNAICIYCVTSTAIIIVISILTYLSLEKDRRLLDFIFTSFFKRESVNLVMLFCFPIFLFISLEWIKIQQDYTPIEKEEKLQHIQGNRNVMRERSYIDQVTPYYNNHQAEEAWQRYEERIEWLESRLTKVEKKLSVNKRGH
jgi:uncharacterized membrane protein